MAEQRHLIAIDQGTTSSRAILFSPEGAIIKIAQKEFVQHYPKDGWVEHNPEDLWETTLEVVQALLKIQHPIAAIGITNQRETTLIWDRHTGKAIYPAIVWQDRRTADYCKTLIDAGYEAMIRDKTGLVLDPYFSASKIVWILEHVEGARKKAEAGELVFGTVECFLLNRLTGGKSHYTDITNASRTMLFNIQEQQWDTELLELFNIPYTMLPAVKDNVSDFGITAPSIIGQAIPITAMIGDQQSAAVGQGCFSKGTAKSTFGTGCFVIAHHGSAPPKLHSPLLATILYRINGTSTYAVEGSNFIAGALIQWLRDELAIISHAKDIESLAKEAHINHGLTIVPALTGLGAPHWQPSARGAIYGLTRNSNKADIAQAALEAIALQAHDLLIAMAEPLTALKVDGGMANNQHFLQLLADITQLPIIKPTIIETTAWGAASLAGLGCGIYDSLEDIAAHLQVESSFNPAMEQASRLTLLKRWQKAMEATLSFAGI